MAVLCVNGKKDLKAAIRRILDTFITPADLSRGVFLKPNIVFPVSDNSGEITRISFVKALVEVMRERSPGIDIIIGEGVAAGCDPQENFRVSGFARLAAEINVPLIDLHGADRVAISWKFGELELPRIAREHTYISLPVLKPSSACVISGALKNQKGLVSAAMKKQFHRLGLHEQIAQLNAAVRPALTIMDCSRFFGRDMFFSGDNCGEIDASACKLLGIEEPEHVHLSRSAHVFVDGYPLSGTMPSIKNTVLRRHSKEFKRLGRLRLWSNPRACSMCRYLFQDIKQHPFRRQYMSVVIGLIGYMVKGAEVIMGSNPHWRKKYPCVICVGECTREIARKNGYMHIQGCPPRRLSL